MLTRALTLVPLFLFVLYPPLLFLVALHEPALISTAALHTERVSVRVVDENKAAFNVAGVKVAPLGSKPSQCWAGLVTPARNATVTYGRIGKGAVEITLAPPATLDQHAVPAGRFEPAEGQSLIAPRGTTYIATDEQCHPPKSLRLPIWGTMEAGQEFRPAASPDAAEPSFLIDGKLEVAAHALWTESIYQVASLRIPVGSRLRAYAAEESKSPLWWGVAIVDPDHEAIDVAAATEAPRLVLFRPYQADVVRLSTLAQITLDPTIVMLQIAAAAVTYLIGISLGLATACHEHEKHRRENRAVACKCG